MDRSDKIARLGALFASLAADSGKDLRTLIPGGADEGVEADGDDTRAQGALEKLAEAREGDVSDVEAEGLEAIVLKKYRPAVFINGGAHEACPDPWTHLNTPKARSLIEPLFASIGCLSLPASQLLPYVGTGFVVGEDLLMTNRHVAEAFARGLGDRGLVLHDAGVAAIDFAREQRTQEGDRATPLEVRDVVMIHPYWDMALLRVEGLPPERRPLTLGVRPPEELVGADVAVVGYPARDVRNDSEVQDRIFKSAYYVKRLQPGKARRRELVPSFGRSVSALIHDSSTLGGNSGSAVLDVATGTVVGLHFGGEYLKRNYAVPAFELARDARVVDAGVKFAGKVPASDEMSRLWRDLGGERVTPRRPAEPPAATTPGGASVTFTLPLEITVTIGQPTFAGSDRKPRGGLS